MLCSRSEDWSGSSNCVVKKSSESLGLQGLENFYLEDQLEKWLMTMTMVNGLSFNWVVKLNPLSTWDESSSGGR